MMRDNTTAPKANNTGGVMMSTGEMRVKDFRLLLSGITLKQLVNKGIPPGDYSNVPPDLQRLSLPISESRGAERILYVPTEKQIQFHASSALNCILEGSRGTGKSKAIRFDAHMRAMSFPGFTYVILRRTMPELRKSHLKPAFVPAEMGKLGGTFNKTESIAYYPNGSVGYYSHCEQDADVEKLLGSEFGAIYFDEITTFKWDMVVRISACARVPEDSGLLAIIRGGTNPIGPGAAQVKKYYIKKNVTAEEDPDYDPDDYVAIKTTLDDNPHIDKRQYVKRLKNLPAHIRRAWLDGEWLVEGAYFADFLPNLEGRRWHVIEELPEVKGHPLLTQSWIDIYRAFDWGYAPDPSVCLWIAVLPNGEEIVFKEKHWRQTLAADVAKSIMRESEGMKIVDTFADPSIFMHRGETSYSIGDLMEQAGLPLSASINDRELFGYAIHDHLNMLIGDRPRLQILDETSTYDRLGCPNLIRTIPEMFVDAKEAKKIAPGSDDHWVVALAYFCIGQVPPSKDPRVRTIPRWMQRHNTVRRTVVSSV